jgi:hypothetical protein
VLIHKLHTGRGSRSDALHRLRPPGPARRPGRGALPRRSPRLRHLSRGRLAALAAARRPPPDALHDERQRHGGDGRGPSSGHGGVHHVSRLRERLAHARANTFGGTEACQVCHGEGRVRRRLGGPRARGVRAQRGGLDSPGDGENSQG